MEDFKSLLALEFLPYGALTVDQLTLLEKHYHLLQRWNSKINLTTISSLTEIVRFHYCESLYLGNYLPRRPLRIVDIGSGAGFPGIPVAIYRSDCEVDLVESNQRKAVFLREASRDLSNVRVLAKRAEDLVSTYDWVISRAVRSRDVLMLNLASNLAVLGTEGEKLPWGESRALFHVER